MIITLSRQLGSDGDAIAARVAAALGLRLVDREAIHKAALAAGLQRALLRQLMYESVSGLAGQILSSMRGVSAELVAGTPPPPAPLIGVFAPLLPPVTITPDEGVQTLGLLIKDIASQGRVRLLGQRGQVWLRGYGGACHVQVVAPYELRTERVTARDRLSPGEAPRAGERSGPRRLPGPLSQRELVRSAAPSRGHQHRPGADRGSGFAHH